MVHTIMLKSVQGEISEHKGSWPSPAWRQAPAVFVTRADDDKWVF